MKNKKNMSLPELLHSDENTVRQITEELPPDWDMEAVFRRSLRRYRQQTGKNPDAPFPSDSTEAKRPFITMHMNTWVTAACLAVTVGIAGAVAWMQFSPQMPEVRNDISQAVTEMHAETTQAVTQKENAAAESHNTHTTALKPAETEQSPQQTTAAPAEQNGSAPSEPDVTAPAHESDEELSAPAQTAPDKAEQSAKETAPPANTEKSGSPQVTTPAVRETAPESPAEPNGDLPKGDAPIDDQDGDAPPGGVAAPANEKVRNIVNEQYGEGYYFQVLENPELIDKEYYIKFEREDQTYYPNPESFSVELEGYETASEHPTEYSYSYRIDNAETGFHGTMSFAGGYYAWRVVNSSYAWEAVTLNRGGEAVPAYHLTKENGEELIWFDGNYLCTMFSKRGFTDEMFAAAEAMLTH